MHVFIAGGTGVLGRRVVRRMIAQGHRVTALTRSTGGGARLLATGAIPAVADVYDAGALARAVALAAPDVVMHQLTDLADRDSAANARIRTVGTANLINAARQAGVRRVVAQSISWAYEPGEKPATEEVPLDLAAGEPRRTTVGGVADLEAAVREVPEWVVLRFGLLYGRGTWYAPGALMSRLAEERSLPANADVSSFIHVDDAAEAAVQALTWPSGAVNICDDEPAPATDWVPVFCRAVGAPPPPADGSAERQGWARGADNEYARQELSWAPAHLSWRDGFAGA